MPAYIRVHIDGGYAGFNEVWSTSFAVTVPSGTPDNADLSAGCSAIRTLLQGTTNGVSNLKAWLSTNGEIRTVRSYYYADVGAPASASGQATGSGISGTGTFDHPPQVCVVMSLLTGTPGASGRGRMYWPGVGASVNSSARTTEVGSVAAANMALTLSEMAELASAVSAGEPAVVSATQGTVTPVTSIRLGDVLDTQRRRRDSLVETYFTASV